MKKLVYIFLGTLLVHTLTGCGRIEKGTTDKSEAIHVKIIKATSGDNKSYVNASGQIEAVKSANLSTRMMGFVSELQVKVGDEIAKGELLVSINNADLQAKKAQVEASIIQASANYNNAKKDHERFVALFDKGSASQKELDDMTMRFQMAGAGLKAAEQMKNEVQAQFSYAEIKAPFAGVVTHTFVKQGDMANPGMPLVSMESFENQQVVALISENNIDHIKNGMDVKVLIKSSNKMLNGKVSEISRSAMNTGGQYMVKVILNNTDDSILSGMYVQLMFPVEKDVTVDAAKVMVPQTALVKHGQLTGIYTLGSEETAILRWLRIGKHFGDQVEVLSGLSADESYIVSSEGRLYNGAKVSIN